MWTHSWTRRVGFVLAAFAAFAVAQPAVAQWKPTRDVEFVIPYGLGGGADLLARTIIKIIADEKLVPTTLVATNRPGGGSAVGVGYVVASKRGDPHTLVLINPQTQITPLRVADAKGWRDLTPVFNFMLDDYLFWVRTASPYRDAAALVAAAKTKPPRSISVGSAGTADDMAIGVFQAPRGATQHRALQQRRRGADSLARRARRCGRRQSARIHGPAAERHRARAGVFRPTRFETMPTVATMKEQASTSRRSRCGAAALPGRAARAVAYWQDVMRKVGETKAFKDSSRPMSPS
jgi:tripartite-type tricarboxylate transporter receptor subunit TctC